MSSSQRVLKCTVCGGDHSTLHCLVICNSCSGNKRSSTAYQGLLHKRKVPRKHAEHHCRAAVQNLYSKLVQHHERVRKTFQSLKTESEELAAELEEKNHEIEELKSAQELADLVKTKEQVIDDLKKSLSEAKTHISAMQEEKFAGF